MGFGMKAKLEMMSREKSPGISMDKDMASFLSRK